MGFTLSDRYYSPPQFSNLTLLEVTVPQEFADLPIIFWDKNDEKYESKSLGTTRLYDFNSLNLERGKEYWMLIQIGNYTVWVKLVGGMRNKVYLSKDAMFNSSKSNDIITNPDGKSDIKNYGVDIIREPGQKPRVSRDLATLGADLDWQKENKKLTIVVVGDDSLQNQFRAKLSPYENIYKNYFRIQYFKPNDWQIRYNTVNGVVHLPTGLTVFSDRNENGQAYILHHQKDTEDLNTALVGALRKVDPKLADDLQNQLPDVRKPSPKPEPTPNPEPSPRVNYESYVVGGGLIAQFLAFLAIIWKFLKEKALQNQPL
jgi:hypothetical protein